LVFEPIQLSRSVTNYYFLQDTVKQNVNRHKEYEESIQRLSGSLASMQGKLKDFTSDYEAANEKAVNEKEIAEKLCPRVSVTKY